MLEIYNALKRSEELLIKVNEQKLLQKYAETGTNVLPFLFLTFVRHWRRELVLLLT